MELRDKRILYKIRIEARHITGFIRDMDFDAFKQNEVTKRAVAMTIANIGELVRALFDSVKSQYNDIPWAAIRQTRNVISHDYEAVNFETIWQTAFDDIPASDLVCQRRGGHWPSACKGPLLICCKS